MPSIEANHPTNTELVLHVRATPVTVPPRCLPTALKGQHKQELLHREWTLTLPWQDTDGIIHYLAYLPLPRYFRNIYTRLWKSCVLSITDDILVYGVRQNENDGTASHDRKLQNLFKRCQEDGIVLSPEKMKMKMKLQQKDITFMGHLTSAGLKYSHAQYCLHQQLCYRIQHHHKPEINARNLIPRTEPSTRVTSESVDTDVL